MDVATLAAGESAVLPDGSIVTRRFNGGFRVRGFNDDGSETVAAYDPDQPRAPRGAPGGIGGQWVARPGGGLLNASLDKLKLADKIPLRDDERLVASASVAGSDNDALFALTHTGQGPELRIGIFADEDPVAHWRAADLGGTARLDAGGMQQLRQTLADQAEAGRQRKQQALQLFNEIDRVRERHEQLRTHMDREGHSLRTAAEEAELEQLTERLNRLEQQQLAFEPDDVIAEGAIPGVGWGDVAWQLRGVDDAEGGWEIALAIRPEDAGPDWDFHEATERHEQSVAFDGRTAELQRLLDQLSEMTNLAAAPVAASDSQRRDQPQAPAGTDPPVMAHLSGEHDQQSHGNRTDSGLPEVDVETSAGQLQLRADETGDVDLSIGDAATTLVPDEVQELADGLDDLLDVDIPDEVASADLVESLALQSDIDLGLYGNGRLEISWDGQTQRVEIDLDPDDVEPTREALQQIVDQVNDLDDDDVIGGEVTAAADVDTGAMVALLPAEDERQRLAVDGGEAPGQLHVTLHYLGQADQFDDQTRARLVAEMREAAAVIPPGHGDGFAVAAFNPHSADTDTAIVLELGGDGLEDIGGIITAAVEEVADEAGVDLPEQHTPWRPHVTLAYSDDLARITELADRAGPVRFDRLRVAFAGENVDIPLTGEGSEDPQLGDVTDDDMPNVGQQVTAQEPRSDRPLRRYWLRGAGAAKIRWNTPGDWTRCVRQLRRHVRDPKGLCAVYHKEATGMWTGDRRHREMHAAADVVAFDEDQPRWPAGAPDGLGGQWRSMHPATDAEKQAFRDRFGKAIPPAWSDVQIADDLDNAPLLVTGRDGKGRRQAIYSAQHTQRQAAKKFQRVQELDKHLDKLDHALERDAGVNDDAAALLLIRKLGMRPGSTRDTQAATQAFGATTLQARHVRIRNGRATLAFTGKKGVRIRLSTRDPAIVDALQKRLENRSGRDRLFETTEARTRDYMRSTGVPDEFLLKDLRTVHANTIALREIARQPDPPTTKREFQQRRRAVATVVSQALGNTPTLALSSYIDPTVFTAWVGDPAWVAAAAGDTNDAAMTRAEEKRLLAGWFATVSFDEPATGIPAVEPDPDDEDDDGEPQTSAAAPDNSAREEEDMPETVVAAAVSDKPWSQFTESDFTVAQLRRSALIVRGDGSTKEQMSLPVREPDGTLNRNAVHAAAGGRGVAAVENITEAQRQKAARRLVRLYRGQLDETPPDSLLELAGMSTSAAAPTTDPQTPAEPGNTTHKEDEMSVSTEVRQRLGLAEDADEPTVLAAIDDLLNRAPDQEQIAAAAATAAENQQLTKQVELLDKQVKDLSQQVSAAAAEKTAAAKKQLLDQAQADGKFRPADRARWETDYDQAPEVVSRVLASIAPGTAVPVNANGSVGDPPETGGGEELDPEPGWLYPPDELAAAGAGATTTSGKE